MGATHGDVGGHVLVAYPVVLVMFGLTIRHRARLPGWFSLNGSSVRLVRAPRRAGNNAGQYCGREASAT